MHVVFVEPWFPRNQREFVRGLAAVGARVSAIGESPLEELDDELRSWLVRYERIGSVVDEAALLAAVRRVDAVDPVDRVEATIEAHILPVARVRAACGLPGTSVRTAFLCRDKPAMKEALRAAGVACAASTGAATTDEARAFAAATGYPLIVKPRDAAGAAGTFRVDDDAGLEHALRASGVDHGGSVAIEEFVEGHEGFYDTLSIDGEPVHDFMCHYYPNILEAMRTRWISPQLISTNRLDRAPAYGEVRELGRKVVEALGIGTSPTHMEWFFGPKGLRFSEIGCRPPGVRAWDLYCVGNDLDLYREWAMALVHGRVAGSASRRYATGMIALRPDRDGRVSHVDGIDEARERFGEWVIDSELPAPGSPTQPVEAGFMANGWVRVRHPDYDELRRMLDAIGELIQIRAS